MTPVSGIRSTGGELAFAVEGVLGVFRLAFRPTTPDVDEVLWVIVGDLPPAYLVVDEAPDWRAALAAYDQEMRTWVTAASAGLPVVDLIPVNVDPTPEHAAMLERRLDFIRRAFLDVAADEVEGDT